MNAVPNAVVHRLVVELSGPQGSTEAGAELRYDPSDPYAVQVVFLTDSGRVVWVFARDLLLRGISEPVGEGDVQVFPSVDPDGRGAVLLALRSPSGQALVRAQARDVVDFLARTTRLVWPGTESEHVSADDAIASLLVGD